jgi:hypothetical protein
MIIHYTKHAEEKFFTLQKHGRQILKEDVTAIVKFPDATRMRDQLVFSKKELVPNGESWEVAFKQEGTVVTVITFYPLS